MGTVNSKLAFSSEKGVFTLNPSLLVIASCSSMVYWVAVPLSRCDEICVICGICVQKKILRLAPHWRKFSGAQLVPQTDSSGILPRERFAREQSCFCKQDTGYKPAPAMGGAMKNRRANNYSPLPPCFFKSFLLILLKF
ncbi:hypothetical protein D0T49_12150 [Paludibacter sp. 221]|nr:hypothetical protein [Paludibacter sp. 221]